MPIQQITSTELQNNSVENYFSSQGFSMGMRNRIINGDMRIDQRYSGSASTINSTSNIFGVDRWAGHGQNVDGVFTIQQQTTTTQELKDLLGLK